MTSRKGKDFKKGDLIKTYKLEEKLWEGTFGNTWKASDNKNTVAIQIIKDERMANEIIRRISNLPLINDDNIAKLLNIYSENNETALIWEYVHGRKVLTFIKELKKIKANVAIYIARKLLETLSITASRGLFHGGIRATRVIVTSDKKVKISNFGIGMVEQRVLSQLPEIEIQNEKYKKILPYFPQEVLEDQIFDDPKSDIYAVGILLAQMLTGKCSTAYNIEEDLASDKIKKRIAAIINKSVADFEERYNHPQEMYNDLTALLKGSSNKEKIYVPPPQVMKSISLEAVPADSEEYRIYQADELSARQTIEADVLTAEPAETDETDGIPEEELTPEQKFRKSVIKQKSKRIPKVEKVIIEEGLTAIGEQILDNLEKEPIWPTISLKYFSLSLAILFTIFIGTFIPLKLANSDIPNWPLIIFYTLMNLDIKSVNIFFLFVLVFFIILPFIDRKGKLLLDHLFSPTLNMLLFSIIGLFIWGYSIPEGIMGIKGELIFVCFTGLGLIVGIILPFQKKKIRN